jgi:hypothetical protein
MKEGLRDKSGIWRNERGMTLVVAILIVASLMIIGFSALMMVSTDLRITGNYRAAQKALFFAEAGVNEALSRLRLDAANPIADAHQDSTQWSAFIGTEPKTQGKGYNSGNAMHVRVSSLQPDLDYTVRIAHQTDSAGNLLYWGDANGDGLNERSSVAGASMRNIYLISSDGSFGGASRTILVEAARLPPIPVPGAFYVNAMATIQGSTNVIGRDGCGGQDLPGIVSTQAAGSVTINGGPNITGAGGATPNILYGGTTMNVQSLVNTLKPTADFKYTVASATHAASTSPGPGDGWGTPTPGATSLSPSSCNDLHVVHYDTGNTDLRLGGSATGCGILIVEGDLMLSGSFSWYGVIIATGSVIFAGGGNKNVTGAILAGGSADADIVGGNASIVYCSTAVSNQTENRPLKILSWKDVK